MGREEKPHRKAACGHLISTSSLQKCEDRSICHVSPHHTAVEPTGARAVCRLRQSLGRKWEPECKGRCVTSARCHCG